MLEWPSEGQSRKGCIDGPAGELEVEVGMPRQAPAGIAVVCHPHPQHGGSKDNKVVFATARACRQAGMASVIFNFRGVGRSQGEYDEGHGETEDALAVAGWALKHADTDRLIWAGFSFGAAVALRAAARRLPEMLATIAMPTIYFEGSLPRPDCAWLAVHGDADDVIDCETALADLRALSPAPEIRTLDGAGHFFHGRLSELGEIISGFLDEQSTASD